MKDYNKLALNLNNKSDLIDNFVNECIRNNINILIPFDKFFSLFEKKYQKKIFVILDTEYKSYNKICSILLPDINLNKSSYLLNYYEIIYFSIKTDTFYSDSKNLISNVLEPYNFTRFSNIKKLNNTKYIFNNFRGLNNISTKPIHKSLKNLGFYMLPKNKSPGFNNFRAIVPYLSKSFKLYFFLDNDKSLMDSYDKNLFKNTTIYYINNMNNEDAFKLIKSCDLSMLIYIYGFYKRKELVLKKPCNIQVHFQEPPVIYPKFCFDYNLIDKHLFEILKKYSDINLNEYNFICLQKNFILPIPFYSDFNHTFKPITNNQINIGVICYDPKICHNFINLINGILKLNEKILITIYGNISKEWFDIIFPSSRIRSRLYNNKHPDELLNNYLFIDTYNYNNHSTALEILKLKIPFIGISNYERYNGCFSQSLLKSIKMEDELLTESPQQMLDLINKYINDKKLYLLMCHKLSRHIDTYFTHEYYSKDFIKTLNDFHDSLN